MISMQEFLQYTEGPHFDDKDWEGIANGDEIFSDDEFEDYMQDYDNYGKLTNGCSASVSVQMTSVWGIVGVTTIN